MSSKNRAARRRAARAHGGTPPDFWGDYGQFVRIGIVAFAVVILVAGGLIVRARQASRAEIDEYCTVYDQTHDEMVGALGAATSTTTAPGTTIAPGTTVAPATPDATTAGSVPGTVPGTTPTTIAPDLEFKARIKAVAEKRAAVGPAKVRAAWTDLLKQLGEPKQTASMQSAITADKAVVSEFAKTECGRDPADF